MSLKGQQHAVMRIYTDEKAKGDGPLHGPLYNAIVKHARDQKIAGATVLRGVVGFGVDGNIQRASILDLAGNLPLTVELVDDEEKLRAFFRSIHGLKDIGLVTLQAIEVLHYDGSQPLGQVENTDINQAGSMTTFKIEHVKSSALYYVNARTPEEAIERLTLHLADVEGLAAWKASPAPNDRAIHDGSILDDAGKDVPSQKF